jgi:hypothetical protein
MAERKTKPQETADDDDLARMGREAFTRAESAESTNRKTYKEDVSFARDGAQWPDDIAKQRGSENRPMLTINRLPAFIRQVVNDARQNKPSIKVHPVDSGADRETAEVINGLIKNIETSSNADIAYDTATECAVSGGFGYIRVTADYSYENSFDMDLCIERVANPLSVYGDPYSTAADSSDWDDAFVVDTLTEDQFKSEYKGKAIVDFSAKEWQGVGSSWLKDGGEKKEVTIAEWWTRRLEDELIVLLSDGQVLKAKEIEENPELQALLQTGVQITDKRMAKCPVVKQHIMSGAEILKTRDWPGKYIPIVPVYGDEFYIDGKRYLRSLIYHAKDPQRQYNYWRTTATELVALAPKVPFIGPKGAFASDPNWMTANTKSHAYLEYDWDGSMPQPPQRQPLDSGPAAGALQEALNANDDMKAVMGLYDASLGARSNETSGKAINARKEEGDVSTFHFVDNMARAIRHTGRILIDLIPHFYNTPRIIRIIGEDGTQDSKPINQEYPATDPKTGQPQTQPVPGPDGQPMQGPDGNPIMQTVMRMHDLRVGKYDLTVSTGPSFTTRREEASEYMAQMVQAYPDAAPVIIPEIAKNSDWPGADKIAEKLEALTSGQVPPQVQQQMDQAAQQIDQLTQENQQLKMDQSAEQAKMQMQQASDAAKLQQQMATDQAKVESQKQIELIKLQANEQIEMAKIASEERIALAKARIQASASIEAAKLKPQPTGQTPMANPFPLTEP